MSKHRTLLLALAFAATLAASLIDFESTSVAPTKVPRPGQATPVTLVPGTSKDASPTPAAKLLSQVRFESHGVNAFATRSWQPPPPKLVSQQVAEPKAPPLPFRYMGKVMENGNVMAFIAQDANTYLARQGDTVLDYRIEEITPAQMTLVFLPLNEKQTLSFGSAN